MEQWRVNVNGRSGYLEVAYGWRFDVGPLAGAALGGEW